MELSLKNLEKHSILFIGSQLALTPENPGPVLVDVDSLSQKEAYQILLNIRRGVLCTTDTLGVLEKRAEVVEAVQSVNPAIAPASATPTPTSSNLSPKKKAIALKKLLAKKIPVVKKEASELSVSDLRELIEIEKSGKNRKSLVPFLSQLYSTHVDQVATKLESLEKNSEKNELTAQTFLDDLPDVIESDKVEVEVPLSD